MANNMFYEIEYCNFQDVLSKFVHLTYDIEDIADLRFDIYLYIQNYCHLNNKVNEQKTRACTLLPFVVSYMFNDHGSECFCIHAFYMYHLT